MFKIEEDVPLPENPQPAAKTYPWYQMKVGDSFEVPSTKRRAAYAAMYAFNKHNKHNMRFIQYTQSNGAMRIWRVR